MKNLKHSLAVLSLLALATACNSLPTQSECEKQVKIYQKYVDLVDAGKLVDLETIDKARLAAQFLEASCGWLPIAKHRALGTVDQYGVLFVVDPTTVK